jgi:transaldolase
VAAIKMAAGSESAAAHPLAMADFHLYLDSADIDALRNCLPHPVVHGVTTNPTLLRRAGVRWEALPDLLEELIALGAQQVQAQVRSADASGMLADADAMLCQVDPSRLVVKIPATREGLRAGSILIPQGVAVTFTAVYALEQAHFAAELGAAYAAPYLGRLNDSGLDGLGLIGEMQDLLTARGAAMRLLVASVRDRAAYLDLLRLGVRAITIPPRLLPDLLDHAATIEAEQGFLADANADPDVNAGASDATETDPDTDLGPHR